MKLLIITLTLLFNIATSSEYKITDITGNIKVNNKKVSTPVKVNSKDIVNISDNSSLKFSNGVTYSKPGNYSVSKIQLISTIKKQDVNSKLANSLLDELSESSDMLEVSGDMSTLGAVERGFHSGRLGYPFNTYIYGDTVTLFWDFEYPVTLEITDEVGNIIYSDIINTNKLHLNLDSLNINYDEMYCWNIETEFYCMKRVREPLRLDTQNPILMAILYKREHYYVDYYRLLKTLPEDIQNLILELD